MKTRYYSFGSHRCHAYMKTVGQGYEVGFSFGKQTVFVGNFIHQKEATKWWTRMNTELRTFGHRFCIGKGASMTWYTKFCSHHLYKCYYTFLDREFTKYHKTYTKAFAADARKYHTLKTKQKWHHSDVLHFRKTA